ncbi:MAG: glycosyltransferase family 2 protein, partial [Acidimicrobiia bacterium]|nr:glycosyltransferase family 2 protein [Acidimicrobiia bacterium]
APIVEFVGWVLVPLAWYLGALDSVSLVLLLAFAYGMGLINSFLAILLDESFGYYNSPRDTARLIGMALVENFGFRQLTVAWRIRALFGGRKTKVWGNMERQGVTKLAESSS